MSEERATGRGREGDGERAAEEEREAGAERMARDERSAGADRILGADRTAGIEQRAGGAPLSNHTSAGRWGVEFPYEWDADDLVSRRQLLRWAVGASGALFAATAGIAGLSLVRPRRPDVTRAIIRARNLAVGDVHYFTYPDAGDQAILLRLAERRYVAYSGKCTHLSCAVYWDAERKHLRCPCHEGLFDPETGGVLAGPPPRPLPKIALSEQDGVLYATGETPS